VSDDQILRDWLVERGHITPEDRDNVHLLACRTGRSGLVSSPEQIPPEEGSEMSDMVNKVELQGTVKWEPRVFEPREEGQKVIVSFAIEWERPKTDKKSVFHVKTFGDLAETLRNDNLGEGDVVTITGSLNESKWKDKKTDEWRNQIETWATKVEIGERAGGEDFAPVGGGESDDDIPF